MDAKYPHWYCDDEKSPVCDYDDKEMMFDDCTNYKMQPFQTETETLKDRIMCMLGNEVMLSVDARICRRETFCGTLCYVGCDFIIVNVCLRGKSASMHIPLRMLRFIAPFRGHRSWF
ncbi:MAG: hypothetical protein K0Q77_1388 [Anaerosporomusa subterranea]|jgi:hypothetical protein|nr:hypothetical protein [Anaerosporomusa subterranea]